MQGHPTAFLVMLYLTYIGDVRDCAISKAQTVIWWVVFILQFGWTRYWVFILDDVYAFRIVIQIMTHLLGLPTMIWPKCQHQHFDIEIIKPDKNFINQFITIPNNRGPTKFAWHISPQFNIDTRSSSWHCYAQRVKNTTIFKRKSEFF